MSEAKFLHYDLKLVEPSFGSELTDLITAKAQRTTQNETLTTLSVGDTCVAL